MILIYTIITAPTIRRGAFIGGQVDQFRIFDSTRPCRLHISRAPAPPPLNLNMAEDLSDSRTSSATQSPPTLTRRAQRLLAVRKAFVPLYKEVIPVAGPVSDTWVGWLSRWVMWQ